MNSNQFWYQLAKLNGLARVLIFPAFVLGSLLTFCSSMARTSVNWYEMPVITIYCNERDFASPADRARALQSKDIPLARCQEKVTWQGEQREAISGLVYAKAEEISNALFAFPQNPAMVREAAAKSIEYFEPESPARAEFKRRMEETIGKSANVASGWTVKDSYVRFIERENPNDSRWIVKFTGIAVDELDSQKGRDVSVMFSFKPTRYQQRMETQQALVVTEWEIIDHGN